MRRAGIALLAAGALVLLATLAALPIPADFEETQYRLGAGPGDAARRYAARGPALVAYDAANDTTTALLACGHGRCPHAIVLEGDLRDALQAPRLILARDGPGDLRAEPLAAPFEVRDPFHPPGNVTTRLSGTFRVVPAWPGIAGVDAGLGLLAAGAGLLLWRRPAWRAPVVGAAAGLVVGNLLVREGGEGPGLLLVLLALGVGTLALILLIVSILAPRLRPAGLALLAVLGGAAAVVLLLSPYFPLPPTL